MNLIKCINFLYKLNFIKKNQNIENCTIRNSIILLEIYKDL